MVLHPRDHIDFADLTEPQGAEMGVLLVRMERALASIGGVGRVHVYKWGDGGAHLHVLVVARPHGMMQLRGMFLSTWMDVLPPLAAEEWTALRSHLAARLTAGASREVTDHGSSSALQERSGQDCGTSSLPIESSQRSSFHCGGP